MAKSQSVNILLIEDDEDDYLLTHEALKEARVLNELYWVKDGEEAMDYLLQKGRFFNNENAPAPQLLLLDLNLPKKDGREVLADIKGNPSLRHIPVVILTTSKAEEDIVRSYDLGVNSFIQKPVSFDQLIETMKVLGKYWFEIVMLPSGK